MSINANPVTSVLFPTGDLLSAGDGLEDLGVGDVGIFDADTNLAINAGGAPSVREFYIAVGVDTTGDGTVDYVAKSAGESIQVSNVNNYASQCYSECTAQVSEFEGYSVTCDNDYIVKLVVTDPEGFINYGYEPVYKSFVVRTSACEDCEDCGEGSCQQFALDLQTAINDDPEGLFTVNLYNITDSSRATPLNEAQVLALETCPVVEITGNCGQIKDFCKIPENYTFPRGTKMEVTFPDWDTPVPEVVVTQELSYEEVAAYDAKFKEYNAHGFNGSYYRLTKSGVQFGPAYQTDLSAEYIAINLGNAFHSHSNPSVLRNGATTTIYMNCDEGDGASAEDVATVLDALLPNFAGQASDIGDCDCIPGE